MNFLVNFVYFFVETKMSTYDDDEFDDDEFDDDEKDYDYDDDDWY